MEAGERSYEEEGRPAIRAAGDGPGASIRLAVALGDPERERALLSALAGTGEFLIVERCLAADQLLACLRGDGVDAALVSTELHRLTGRALEDLARARIPTVLLAPASWEDATPRHRRTTLPAEADPERVRQALLAAARGNPPGPVTVRPQLEAPAVDEARPSAAPPGALGVVAIASGHGAPGRTTIAIGLATVLGTVAPTVLVDADLSGPSLAAHLDADPTRNLYMLAHASPDSPAEWGRAIDQELQPLSARSPYAALLCGVPKPEMRSGVSVRFLERLLSELRARYRYVILDVGAELLGTEAAVHRTALERSDQILLVTGGDLVSLWHTRTAVGILRSTLAVAPDRLALVINGHDRRHHHGRSEIEWALGLAAAAVIPRDHGSAQRAIAAQKPLTLEGGRAARALLDLAERLHGARVLLPPEPAPGERPARRSWLLGALLTRLGRGRGASSTERGTARG